LGLQCKVSAAFFVLVRQEDLLLPGHSVAVYRPRRPRESPLYALVDECYDEVKGSWEERFERRYGFCRATIEDAVFASSTAASWVVGLIANDSPFEASGKANRATECRPLRVQSRTLESCASGREIPSRG
jgi:hypothetical protein